MTDLTEELPLESEPPRRSRGRMVALAVASVAVLLGAGFAAINLAGGDDNSPADPVRAMFAAAERGDAVGVMEQLDPGERDALRAPLEHLTAELNRIGVLKDASLSHISGVDLKISDLALASTPVRDGLASVRITGGKSNYTIDQSQLPLGKFIRDLAGDGLSEKQSGSDDLKSDKASDAVAVVKRGGHWYVSIGYSVVEQGRKDKGVSVTDLGAGVPANGAASPQDAVRDLILAATKLDVRRMIELLPPDELAALHEYAGLFIDDTEKSVQQMRDDFTISIPTLEMASDTNGDESLVTITKAELSAKFGDTTVSVKDGCADITTPGGKPQHLCQGMNPTAVFKSIGFGGDLQPPDFSFKGKHAKVGFVTTKVDGKWYVSPTRTLLDDVVETLKLVQPSDLDKGRDWVNQLKDSFLGGSFNTSTSETSTTEG